MLQLPLATKAGQEQRKGIPCSSVKKPHLASTAGQGNVGRAAGIEMRTRLRSFVEEEDGAASYPFSLQPPEQREAQAALPPPLPAAARAPGPRLAAAPGLAPAAAPRPAPRPPRRLLVAPARAPNTAPASSSPRRAPASVPGRRARLCSRPPRPPPHPPRSDHAQAGAAAPDPPDLPSPKPRRPAPRAATLLAMSAADEIPALPDDGAAPPRSAPMRRGERA
nr:vegetative cell wall protein gp1-like [Lolium perenne]